MQTPSPEGRWESSTLLLAQLLHACPEYSFPDIKFPGTVPTLSAPRRILCALHSRVDKLPMQGAESELGEAEHSSGVGWGGDSVQIIDMRQIG